jgi:hypothetical protein
MKKIVLSLSLVTLFAVSGLCYGDYSSAFGLYGDYGIGGYGTTGIGLALRVHPIPIMWGLEWNLEGPGFLSITGDYWVINAHLGGSLEYYIGIGGYLGLGGGSGGGIGLGARIPIGLQMFPVGKFEVFVEIAPVIYFIPAITLAGDFRIGIRIHF